MRKQLETIEFTITPNDPPDIRITDKGVLTDQLSLLNEWIMIDGIDLVKKLIGNNLSLPIVPNEIGYYSHTFDVGSWINYENKEYILTMALQSYFKDYDDWDESYDYDLEYDSLER